MKFKHIANIRDLGGIPAADGRTIKPGRLLRGGHLNKLTDEEANNFKELTNLALVLDLRSPSELAEKPDNIPEGVSYKYIPSLTNEQNPSINRHNRLSELRRIMKVEGGAVGHLSNLYRLMITQDMARESHHNLLMSLVEMPEGACYWHCTQGKDRTGVAAAVILMALGATREEILKDYLNEHRTLKVKNGFLTSLVGTILFNLEAKRSLSALMNAKRPCMEAALDEIKKVYGTFENYLLNGLNITNETILKLRELYLE